MRLCFGIWFGSSLLSVLLPATVAQAQVTIDGTLNTTVTSQNGLDFRITNGSTAGANLFHSFENFSVPTNGSATFDLTTTPNISTIFSRVTGPNPSGINGSIQTLGGTNSVSLFLLNPQGIIFGPKASLNISGSFFGTTAETIKFADGNSFSTTGAVPLLTLSLPIGLQMGQGLIRQEAASLKVKPGQTIGLIGSDVTISGGELIAPAGRIAIVSMGSDGSVTLSPEGVLVDRPSPMQDIQIQNQSIIDVSGPGGGSIQVQGRQIQLNNGAAIVSNTLGAQNGGNISINARERLELSGTTPDESAATNITARARVGSTGQGSSITIAAPQLKISNGAQVVSRADSQGNAGNISVQAQDILAIGESRPNQAFPSGIISRTEATATGRGGNVTIDAQTIQVLDGAEFRASSRGAGQAGNFTVRARSLTADSQGSTVSLTGISTSTRRGTGNGGDILLEVDDLKILGGAAIRTGSTAGNAGSIRILARQITMQGEDVDGYRAELYTFAEATAKGNAGNIQIDTDALRILDGAVLYASTTGKVNAGNILINAQTVDITGTTSTGLAPSLLQTAVGPGSTGQGGQITINSRDRIQVANGSQISAATFGVGNAGNIRLDAATIVITGTTPNGNVISSISTSSENIAINGNGVGQSVGRATGNGGAITIRADQLQIADGATIRSSTEGDGNAGDINVRVGQLEVAGSRFSTANETELSSNINAYVGLTSTGQGGQIKVVADQVRISDGGSINSSTQGAGNAGGIQIQANNIDLVGQSRLSDRKSAIFSGSQQGNGNAGTIELAVRDRLFATKGVISTETTNGNGGTVNLVAGDLELRDQSLISTASMGAGKAGNVMIRSGQVNLNDSQITSRSRGFGDGGSIDLTAQTLRLNRNSTLNAQTTSGNGGNLDLKLTDLLQLRDRSLLSAAAGGNGNGGNIRLSAPFIVGFEDSDIVANAFEGRGGNIQITADGIFGLKYRTERTAGNDITASSLFGVNGDVQIQILSIDSTSSLGLLPIDGVDRSRQVDRQCSSGQSSSFVTTGRSGLPETPVQRLQLAALWQDNRAASVSSFAPMARSIQSVAEATDWQQGANGAVELVARSNGVRSGFQANCATVK